MKFLYKQPLDEVLAERWNSIDPSYKLAFFIVAGINVLAFGFEMTNLTLHHDDVAYIFIQDTILGHYLGRFGLGWLNYYMQNAYYMPFLQMVEGIVFMTAYGMLTAHFWSLRKTMDIVLVSSVLCVFPYMGNVFAYNVTMATLPMAYLLAASAVVISTRATPAAIAVSALLYVGAFSIYQSVIANAATIFAVWMLAKLIYEKQETQVFLKETWKPLLAATGSAILGGLLYVAIVLSMDIKFDTYQAAGEAFTLSAKSNILEAVTEVLEGTRAFLLWPENYFPNYLKKLQLVLVLVAATLCVWLPRDLLSKIIAVVLLLVVLLSPRIVQLLHPQGTYHANALTAYAVAVAGCVMIIIKSKLVVLRNISAGVTMLLLAGYIMQCNWISTVNYLNTLAHYTALTQILARIKSLPSEQWDGKNIVVVGSYNMRPDYPYKKSTGVATTFLDAPHIDHLARLMREDYTINEADKNTPAVLAYAENVRPWPHTESISVHEGMAVVVLSNKPQ